MIINIDAADQRYGERSEARACLIQRGGAMNAIFDVTEDQALDGQPIRFGVPFPYKGDLIMLRAGCFGDVQQYRVGFWIDHVESLEVASTALELMMDDDGLQFRLDLGQCKLGPVIARMCNTDNRSSMSVGSDILAEHREELDGQTIARQSG